LPSDQYIQRRSARQSLVVGLERTHIRLGNVRLLLAVAAVTLLWASFRAHYLSPWWLAAPIAAFGSIAYWHSRVLRNLELTRRAVAFYERGLARIQDRWAGTGETGDRFNDPHHVYAADLDLFGNASLFQLLSSARTRVGEETLARWLLSPAPLEQIRARHAALGELRSELDLREHLAVLGEDARVGVHPEELIQWAESPNQMKTVWIAWLAPVLAAAAIAGAITWAVWDLATPLFWPSLSRRCSPTGFRNRWNPCFMAQNTHSMIWIFSPVSWRGWSHTLFVDLVSNSCSANSRRAASQPFRRLRGSEGWSI